MEKEVLNVGEFTLVAPACGTHVWLTRGYLENEHPVLDTLQIPTERLQAVIGMLEAHQVKVDEAERVAAMHRF